MKHKTMPASRRSVLLMLTTILVLTFVTHPFLYSAGKKVGVVWYGKSGMAQRVLDGFQSFMKDKAPDIEIILKTELADADEALKAYQQFQLEADGVVFLRSTALPLLQKSPPQKPTFIGACNNPVALGAVKSMEAPGGNISGVTYHIPIKQRFAFLKLIFPKVKHVSLLLEDGHPSSDIDAVETRATCIADQIEYHEIRCRNTDDLKKAVQSVLEKKSDVIILGNQSLLIDHSEIVAQAAGDIPIFSYSEIPIIQKNATAGMVADDEKLGRMLANSVILVVDRGRRIGDIKIQSDPQPKVVLNMDMIEKYQIKIPAFLMKAAKKIR